MIQRDEATGSESYDEIVKNGVYADMTFGLKAFHQNRTSFNDPAYFSYAFTTRKMEYEAIYDTYKFNNGILPSESCINHDLFIIDSGTGLNPIG